MWALVHRVEAGDLEAYPTDPSGAPCMLRPHPGPLLAFFAPTCLAFGEGWRFQPARLDGTPTYADSG